MMSHIKRIISLSNINKNILYALLISVLLISFGLFLLLSHQTTNSNEIRISQLPVGKPTLFSTQCIDTMKVSRDRAKEDITEQRKLQIHNQVTEIAHIGANCIALGTPYNDEFIPYLKLWVDEARKYHLHVWFRGNFAEWEGWFGYKKSLSTADHIKLTQAFITNHAELFQDGDIFTASPELENGGPFHPVDSPQKAALLRSFLIDEQNIMNESFKEINKKVITNYVSMSGGVAKIVLDKPTIEALNNTVTLDHYVTKPEEIDQFISYFSQNYQAKVAFGEFGAPIPDLNGHMNEEQQATFVSQLLQRLYENRGNVPAVNYWTLTESSTALLREDGTEKSVVGELMKYYKPTVVEGVVIDNFGKVVPSVTIQITGQKEAVKTNAKGEFHFVIPQFKTSFHLLETEKFSASEFSVNPTTQSRYFIHVTLVRRRMPILYRLRSLFHM